MGILEEKGHVTKRLYELVIEETLLMKFSVFVPWLLSARIELGYRVWVYMNGVLLWYNALQRTGYRSALDIAAEWSEHYTYLD